MQKSLLYRKILSNINPWIDKKEIILVIGPRQAGKTSLLSLIRKNLLKRGITEKNIFYFDLEDFNLLSVFNQGVKAFLQLLQSKGAALGEKSYVFIDEIQYLENPSNFLKLLADHHPEIKIFASGSSTLAIRQKFKDSLAGRKIVFELLPLDFIEFLSFKGREDLAKLIEAEKVKAQLLKGTLTELKNLQLYLKELWAYYQEYALFGGYPRVVLENEHALKIELLKELFNTYVRKDIKDLMRIDDVLSFNDLIKFLALNIGNLLNYNSLTTSLGTARDTLKKYIFLLENTFIIGRLPPYHTNRKKEISKMSKVFFIDAGLRNFVLNDFNNFANRSDKGFLLENTIYGDLAKNKLTLENIYFWRTISKQEVDFVLQHETDILPIEVKSSPAHKTNLPAFLTKYSKQNGAVITPETFEVLQTKNHKIFVIPAPCFC